MTLQKNGVIVYLNRTPESILQCGFDTENRPLLQNPQELYKLYEERQLIYRRAAHYIADNNTSLEGCLKRLLEIAQTVSQKQQLYLIGFPVEHSLSPAIHRPVLDALCDSGEYTLQRLKPDELESWVQEVRRGSIAGFNVTMPHKLAIMPYLDELDESVQLYGSVNTVVCRGGRLKGYNTDGEGFYCAMEDRGIAVKGKRLLFLGGGGAAKALIAGALLRGAGAVTVLVRTPQKLHKHWQGRVGIEEFTGENLSRLCRETDLLLHCTPMGMQGVEAQFSDFAFLQELASTAAVVDLIYAPRETLLLKNARNRGLKTANGIGMLVYQALLAERYYLQADFDMQVFFQKAAENMNSVNRSFKIW